MRVQLQGKWSGYIKTRKREGSDEGNSARIMTQDLHVDITWHPSIGSEMKNFWAPHKLISEETLSTVTPFPPYRTGGDETCMEVGPQGRCA